jgi:hypothetical protein
MKGIQGVNDVAVDLNTGLVTIKLASGNTAGMRQFNEAVEKTASRTKTRRLWCAAALRKCKRSGS